MKILLTTRRVTEEKRNPISLLDLAAFLRGLGHTVDCYYLDQLEGLEEGRSYDLAGLSVLQVLDENVPVRDAIALKNRFKARTVVGGKWTETLQTEQAEALRSAGIEICVGQGERFFKPGDVDFAAYPPWDAADLKTLGEVNPEVMSARGCPYRCNFCHNTEKTLSFFSVRRTADNIELLLKAGGERIFIVDDIFTLNAARMAELLRELDRRGIDIRGRNSFFTHVNHLKPDILAQIAAYRPDPVDLGIESGDDRMLKLMSKPFTSAEAFDRIRLLYRMGIKPVALFLLGFPGENEESLRNTLRFIERIEPYVEGAWMSYYQPVRGTRGYEMAMERVKGISRIGRNTEITYLDPALSEEMLSGYRTRMARLFSRRTPRGFLRRVVLRNVRRIFTPRPAAEDGRK